MSGGCPILHGDPATAFVLTVILLLLLDDDSNWRECIPELNDPKRRKLWLQSTRTQ